VSHPWLLLSQLLLHVRLPTGVSGGISLANTRQQPDKKLHRPSNQDSGNNLRGEVLGTDGGGGGGVDDGGGQGDGAGAASDDGGSRP
jgi:hypothetical protein